MMCFHHNSFNVSSFQLLRGSEHQRKLLEGLLQRGWKQVFFLEELKSLVFVHPSSFSIWIHTMLKPRIAFLGRAQSDSLGKLHGNAFNSIFRQKCPVFGTLFDAEAGTREFPQHFSPGLFHYYATSSSLNEKSFERNQQLRIKYQVLSNHLQYNQLSGQVFMPMTKATSLTWWRHILLTPCLPPGGFLFIKLNDIILFSYC